MLSLIRLASECYVAVRRVIIWDCCKDIRTMSTIQVEVHKLPLDYNTVEVRLSQLRKVYDVRAA